MKHTAKNSLLCEAFQYATNYTTFFNILNNGDSIRKYSSESTLTQQILKKAGYNSKKSLRNEYARNWLEAQESVSLNSRAKFTPKEVKKHYQFEDYLNVITNPAHRISVTRLRLGAHALRIQTGKYENKGASIPVEERTCLICNRNRIEDEQHFLMYCQEYDDIRHELHSVISKTDSFFTNLTDEDKIKYLLTLDNENNPKIIGKYIHLMFQKREEILKSKSS